MILLVIILYVDFDRQLGKGATRSSGRRREVRSFSNLGGPHVNLSWNTIGNFHSSILFKFLNWHEADFVKVGPPRVHQAAGRSTHG